MEKSKSFPRPFTKLLMADPKTKNILGPLAKLPGTWKSEPGSGTGWNVIAVPAAKAAIPPGDKAVKPVGDGFALEVIPYHEELVFSPGLSALNRGPVVVGSGQVVQSVGAVIYTQKIISDCDTDYCKARGFGKGSTLHEETGMLLNMDQASGLSIARSGTIPHGNSILCLGSFTTDNSKNPVPKINGDASTLPTFLNHDGSQLVGYAKAQYGTPQFDGFPQETPNQQLIQDIKGQTFKSVTHISLSTEFDHAGILNIPFISHYVDTQKMLVDYWIEEVNDPSGKGTFLQLQYSQFMNLVFPDTGNPALIIWPHADVNTLRLVAPHTD